MQPCAEVMAQRYEWESEGSFAGGAEERIIGSSSKEKEEQWQQKTSYT